MENEVETQAKHHSPAGSWRESCGTQYAISQYHDTKEIYAKLDSLVSQPLRPVKREKMQEFLCYFENQCKRSKALTDEAKKYIPEDQ